MTRLRIVAFVFLLGVFQCANSEIIKSSPQMKDNFGARYLITQFESPVQEVLWCGIGHLRSEEGDYIKFKEEEYLQLYVLTTKGSLYYSQDYGFSFKEVNKDLQKLSNKPLTNATVSDIMLSPVNNKKVFIFTKTGESYYTEDCGSSYKYILTDKNLNFILPNPFNENMLLGLIPMNCENDDPECNELTSDLMVSKDSGTTWTLALSLVEQAQWDKSKQNVASNQNRIILAHQDIYKDESGRNITSRRISYSDNFGKSLVLMEKQGIRFLQTADYIFILKTTKVFGEYQLIIGPSLVTQSAYRKEIDLPLKRVKDESFTVLDLKKGSICISINHEGDESGYTNVYISNAEGKQFSLSLQYTVGDEDSTIDFESIDSNEGTYIANTYSSATVKKYQQFNAKRRSQLSSGNQLSQQDIFEISKYRKTKVSFNKGGDWHYLKAPAKNIYGNDINCSGECSLNLKGRTESSGTRIYSSPNSPGIVLGIGNVDQYLTTDPSELKAYISVDGAHNWKEIQSGSYEYEIADQGGIIAMGRDDIKTGEVIYSVDEGDTWRKLLFPDYAFSLNSFVTTLGNEERGFLFYGVTHRKGEALGVFGTIDFTKIFSRDCEGFDRPNEPNSDYERWVPENYQGKKCVFGEKISYIRKKKDAECYNHKSIGELRKEVEACECTEEDFECDFGFTKDAIDPKVCSPINKNFSLQEKQNPPTNCQNFYFISQGYRKVPNNQCQGGYEEKYAPKKLKCPEKPNQNQGQGQQDTQQKQPNNSGDNFTQKNDKINNKPTTSELPQQQEPSSYLSILGLIAVLGVLYYFRQSITSIFSKGSHLPNSKKPDTDSYGYKKQQNNAEQYSLFQNNEEDDDFEPNEL